jgi:HupE / UreJ protein
MRLLRRVVIASLLAAAAAWAVPAAAHPVAQGALTVVVSADRVSVRAAVSSEEVLVAAVSGGRAHARLVESERSHGAYLLAHLRLAADGRALHGRVVRIPEAPTDRPVYELEYLVSGTPATRLSLEQDVLREFEFAPGNPWEATYVVRLERPDGVLREGLLLTSRAPLVVDLRRASGLDLLGVGREYLGHGVVHILTGWDHVLFVIALVLAVTTVRNLVLVVTAFTLAHSVTLTLAVLDVVRLPSSVVEPVIALSIVVVALQNAVVPRSARGVGRLAVAFAFGLFHGLGFAGGLLTAMEGMAGAVASTAIAGFSVGVELGHQAVVLPIFGVLALLRFRAGAPVTPAAGHVLRYGSAAICAAGVFYLIEALR